MNDNLFTRLHTYSSHASARWPLPVLQREEPQIHGLDSYGRRRQGDTGSDFFDFIPRPDANLAVCMGAAAVPGADSELMVSGLENLLRSLSSRTSAKPSVLVETLNRSVCGASGANSYATLFYAAVDPLRRQLRYVNAGHEAALLLRKRHSRAIELESTGAVLGLTLRSSYGQRTIPLEPGDLLAVFSDSVAEAVDILGRPFGPGGVLKALRRSANAGAAELVEEILDAAERHAGWGVPPASQSVAVVRFTGGRAEAASAEAENQLAFAAA